jgi:hypothetical protein
MIRAHAVDSSVIKAIAYEVSSRQLWIQFTNGACYRYGSVPEHLFATLLAAASKGSFFHRAIRNVFAFAKMPDGTTLI